jgi:hypothetical protein
MAKPAKTKSKTKGEWKEGLTALLQHPTQCDWPLNMGNPSIGPEKLCGIGVDGSIDGLPVTRPLFAGSPASVQSII